MCTVTILRSGDTLRVGCNRDERRGRAAAYPPFISLAGRLQVLAPQDPEGRGTWIAANSAGLVFVLLNVSGGRERGRRSRGLVIPALAGSRTLVEAVSGLRDLSIDDFAPFRLVVADSTHVVELASDAGDWDARVHNMQRPLLFTSSSLGDALVDGPRRHLFETMLGSPGTSAQQDAFHAHRWRDRPAVSVHMSRPDACTVSTTMVEVAPRELRMTYLPAHDAAGTHVGLAIRRQDITHAAAHWPGREHAAV